MSVLVYTDGPTHAGDRDGHRMQVDSCFQFLLNEQNSTQAIADGLLEHAMISRSRAAESDDISVVVLQVCDWNEDEVRRMSLRPPFWAVTP